LLPLSVLSVHPWTRFVTPGSETTAPDLGATLSFSPTPALHFYMVHDGETYRISFAISQDAVANLNLMEGRKGLTDNAAIVFELGAGAAEFWMWSEGDHSGSTGAWTPIADFTGGVVIQGGRCDMTGAKEVSSMSPGRRECRVLIIGHRTCVPPNPSPSRLSRDGRSSASSLVLALPYRNDPYTYPGDSLGSLDLDLPVAL